MWVSKQTKCEIQWSILLMSSQQFKIRTYSSNKNLNTNFIVVILHKKLTCLL